MKNKLIILLASLLYGLVVNAEPVSIPGTETKPIYSDIVQQDYQLLVNLPAGYAQGKQHYPVLYLLDAQWDFPLISSIYGEQYYDGFVPGLIIIGITWGGKNPNPDQLRRRDFTPSDVDQDGSSGGAENFLNFIQQELIPFVDKHYRTTEQRTLMGSSLGGLFTLYSLFNQPNLFANYIPSSPAVNWDNNVLYTYTKNFEKKLTQQAKLFMPVSELEGLYQPVMQFAEFLQQKHYAGLQWRSHTVMGAGHSGVKAEGNTRGLQYVFQPADLDLTHQQLSRYIGQYQSQRNNQPIKITIQSNKLQLHLDQNKLTLSAADKLNFYHRGEFVKLHFDVNTNNEITGVELLTYGQSQHFDKQ